RGARRAVLSPVSAGAERAAHQRRRDRPHQPPGYVTAATNDFWKGKDMSYPAGFADSVRRGYPDLGSLVLPVSAAKAYGLAHATAMGMSGWEVTGRDSAGGGGGGRGSGGGRSGATATTAGFGFKDDGGIRGT